MMPYIFDSGRARATRDVVAAAVLVEMSEEEIARPPERLADYAADKISERDSETLGKQAQTID